MSKEGTDEWMDAWLTNTIVENQLYLPNCQRVTLVESWRSGNAKSQLETVIEHLVGRQGQPRRAQVYAMQLSDQKGWSQDPPLPRPHLRVGSRGEGISCQSSLPTWDFLMVSSSFSSFLQLLYLGLFSFAEDFTTLLVSWYFLSHYGIMLLLY